MKSEITRALQEFPLFFLWRVFFPAFLCCAPVPGPWDHEVGLVL